MPPHTFQVEVYIFKSVHIHICNEDYYYIDIKGVVLFVQVRWRE